jgi:hypothetical protein
MEHLTAVSTPSREKKPPFLPYYDKPYIKLLESKKSSFKLVSTCNRLQKTIHTLFLSVAQKLSWTLILPLGILITDMDICDRELQVANDSCNEGSKP